MKTIKFSQTASVIETAEYIFDENDFNYLVENHDIDNITYEDVCDIFEGKKPDFLITVVDDMWVEDEKGSYFTVQPHMVSAYSFFNSFMENEAWDSYVERELTDITDARHKIQQNLDLI